MKTFAIRYASGTPEDFAPGYFGGTIMPHAITVEARTQLAATVRFASVFRACFGQSLAYQIIEVRDLTPQKNRLALAAKQSR